MPRSGMLSVCITAMVGLAGFGCGETAAPGGQVSGKVIFKGVPVPNARVIFLEVPVDEKPPQEYSVLSDEMGVYNLTGGDQANRGVKPGQYTVRIYQLVSKDGKRLPPDMDAEQLEASGAGKNALPAIYASKTKSPLKATVKEGPNEIDFSLEEK